MIHFRWVIYLFLVVVGFYFGKYLGAIALPLLYYVTLKSNQPSPRTKQPDASVNDWAYQVLQITANADAETVRKARKKRINQHHPDKLSPTASAQEKRRASEKINEINRAFDAIMKSQHEK